MCLDKLEILTGDLLTCQLTKNLLWFYKETFSAGQELFFINFRCLNLELIKREIKTIELDFIME